MGFSKDQIIIFNKLRDYYKNLGDVMKPRVKNCGPCIDCCAYLVTTIPSPLEIDYARYCLINTGNPQNLPLFSWEDYLKRSGGLCIYIDPEKKACTLYEARFNICRIYGPYIPDTDITMYGKCVYKGISLPRCFQEKLVPYQTEFYNLVDEYLKFVPENIQNLYRDITACGATAEKRLEYTLERYEYLVSKYPHISDLHFWLGRTYISSGRIREGFNSLVKSIDLCPEQLEAYLDIGLICYQNGELDNSEKAFREALKNCPGDGQSLYMLVLTLIRQKKFNEASLEFSRLLDESFQYDEKILRDRELIDLL